MVVRTRGIDPVRLSEKFCWQSKAGRNKDEIFVREIVLPYLSGAIDAATKKGQRLSTRLGLLPMARIAALQRSSTLNDTNQYDYDRDNQQDVDEST